MPKEEIQKAMGQFRLQMNGVMSPFTCYGLNVYVPRAVEETLSLAMQLHRRLNGEDTPIQMSSF